MREIIVGRDAEVAQWVSEHIPHMAGDSFGPNVAIGVAIDGRLIGGVVFHDFIARYKTIQWSAASTDPRWLTPKFVNFVMTYAFEKAGSKRITAIIPRRGVAAQHARSWHVRFGFKKEGLIRNGFGSQDAVIYGLTRLDWSRSPFNPNRIKPAPVSALETVGVH